MSLKNNWVDLVDGESEVVVKPINDMAHAIIEVEDNIQDIRKNADNYKQIVAQTEYLGNVEGRVVKQTFNLNGGIVIKDSVLI